MLPYSEFTSVGKVSNPFSEAGEKVFLFDLDTLVPSPFGRLDEKFARYLCDFAQQRPCYLLTNANYGEVMNRLPSHVRRAFAGVFAAAATELWGKYDIQVRHEHDFSDDLYEFLVKVVQTSAFSDKRSPMLDNGSASLRMRLSGTHSTANQRAAYATWEQEQGELPAIMNEFRIRFPDYRIYRDSDTSLLILPATFSTALVRSQLLMRHKTACLIGYLSPQSVTSYAAPLCEALLGEDVLSHISAPSDVSQLLSYEIRHMVSGGSAEAATVSGFVEA
ncbi:hypothetical protein [Roseibium aggregatum]|uniref:hypothetical protein n=1 Tax=Roseibium aggregatum TaxID=187304 RepID=UPI001A8FA836|nr:hypothetical protein [Roseibium aggregatum]MBN8184713.1 hypothetical protein [Roseibium aggregatum]